MELIKYLNQSFWKNSGYMVLFAVAIIYIMLTQHRQSRGFRMVLYTVLCFGLVVYNPAVANLAMHFFMEDPAAYLRIFYVLPIMTILAYASTEFYCTSVEKSEGIKKKAVFLIVICMAFVMAGKFFDDAMFIKAENIYKIDSEALEIADYILEDGNNEQVGCIFQKDDNLIAGIRQYTDKIIIADVVDTIRTPDQIHEIEYRDMFGYVVIEKEERSVQSLEAAGYSCVEETEQHYIFRRGGN